MRHLLAVLLTILCIWNTVPGGMGVLVVCLHPEGKAHVELAESAGDCSGSCGGVTYPQQDSSHCSACVDVVLETHDLGSCRPNEAISIDVPAPALAELPENLPDAVLRPGVEPAYPYPTRGPPNVDALSQLICRTVVLRL